MSVYVDPLIDHGWQLGPSCHMFASSEEELHAFAARLSLKRVWYQAERVPHYDLTRAKRAFAVRLGAIELPVRAAAWYWRARGWTRIEYGTLPGEELTR